MGVDGAEARKARGAFFTPGPVAKFMARWAVRSPTDRILEPSCGEAAFLAAASRLVGDAGRLDGVELHERSAVVARQLVPDATISVSDFFDVAADQSYDAVIGNPPYVRYQDFTGLARAAGQRAALAAGVALPGLSSSWAPFVAHAVSFLASGGRLALVLPGELLSVNYAEGVRQLLAARFEQVHLVAFDDLVFPDATEDVVLLLAEGDGPASTVRVHHIASAADLDAVDLDGGAVIDPAAAKWTSSVVGEGTMETLGEVVGFEPLGSWGAVSLGAVTGNNKWFLLTADEARVLRLSANELTPMSPPGSAHLRGLSFTNRAWDDLSGSGKRVWLFNPGPKPSAAARARIVDGELNEVHLAYKCRVREPWWTVPGVYAPDLMFTYMNHVAPQLVANRAGVGIVNSVHGVHLAASRRQVGMDLLPLAALNSATLLSAELGGRAYGGGMLKLEPKEAASLPVPSLKLVTEVAEELRALRPVLSRLLRIGDLAAASRHVDDVVLARSIDRAARRRIEAGRQQMFERRSHRGRSARAHR